MALAEKERKQLMVFVAILAPVAAVAFWMYWRTPRVERATEMLVRIESLQARVDSARRDLAAGTVEALRQRVRDYEGSLSVMRRLVPTGAEVPTLIDDVSNRSKRRDVNIQSIDPQTPEAGSPFEVHRYRFTVLGHYDEVAEFLTDIASLPRIMVPYDLSVARAQASAAQTFGDTTGAVVTVTFSLRTFVKPVTAGAAPGGGN